MSATGSSSGNVFRALVGALSALVASAVFAQAYPTRPIEIIAHNSAGSGSDLFCRSVAEIIRREKLLPQPLQVVNRVGGAGTVAFNFFKSKRADPYYMLSVNSTMLVMAYRPDMSIGLENYTPVALMAIDPQVIMVPANSPYKTFKELAEAARSAPGTLVAATTSLTGAGRLVVYLIEQAVPGAKFRIVTFKGGGDAVTATAGGHTTFTTENLGEGLGFVEAKTLRVLAITSNQRLPHAPDVPTLQELGYRVTAGTMRGLAFPGGVPKETVTLMEGKLEQVHKTAAWKEYAKRNILEDVFMGSAEFTKYLAQRLEESRGFYDAIGLGKSKP
jgi:putative tricarboxylic transport membrane protein